jgi:hypothetical protein
MGERGTRLAGTTDRQISELIGLLAAAGGTALNLPCPGRQRLGDGTVGAIASHTADGYHRIAAFLETTVEESHGGHAPGGHGAGYSAANVHLGDVLARLLAAKGALALLADLSDEQLDVVPSAGDMKFCDGQRTLERVVTSLLKHQRHQIDAVTTALETP